MCIILQIQDKDVGGSSSDEDMAQSKYYSTSRDAQANDHFESGNQLGKKHSWSNIFITFTITICIMHTFLKCNLVNFDIPNQFLHYGNCLATSRLTRLPY